MVRERSSRTLGERLVLRFPRLFDPYVRLIGRLPPTSRIRQAAVSRGMRQGMEAFNRRDLDAAVSYGGPDFELRPPPEFVQVGFEPGYRGRVGLREYVSAWSEVFPDLRVEPVEVIDLGDCLVMLAELP
jgi:hypothetical protein